MYSILKKIINFLYKVNNLRTSVWENKTLFKNYILAFFCFALTSCIGFASGSNSSNSDSAGKLTISTIEQPMLYVGKTANIKVSLVDSSGITQPLLVRVNSSDPKLARLSPGICYLTTANDSCTVGVEALASGEINITASASGYSSVTTNKVTLGAIVIGNIAGLVYLNDKWLKGDSAIKTLDGSSPRCMLIDKGNSIYIGTAAGEVYMYNTRNNSWQNLNLQPLNSSPYGTYALLSDNKSNIYALTPHNVFKYIGNNHWQRIGQTFSSILSDVAIDNNNLYLAKDSSVLKYNEVNNIWESFGANIGGIVMQVATDNIGNVYVRTNQSKVYQYQVDGSWKDLGALPLSQDQISVLAVDKLANIYVGTKLGNLYKYETNNSWSSLGLSNRNHSQVNFIISDKKNNIYVSTTDKNIFKLAQNGWEELTQNTLDNLAPYFLMIDEDDKLYSLTHNAIYKYDELEAKWDYLFYGSLDGSNVYSLEVDKLGNIYAGTSKGNVFEYSSNGSQTWRSLGAPDGSNITSLVLDDSNNIYIATFKGEVFKYNKSEVWEGLSLKTLANKKINSLALDNLGYIYAALDNGKVFKFDGSSWSQLGTGSIATTVTSIALDKANNIYAITNTNSPYKAYRYVNNKWESLGNKAFESMPKSIVVDNNNTIYVGTAKGNVLKFDNSIESWVNFGTGLVDGSPINSLTIDKANNLNVASRLGNLYWYDKTKVESPWINMGFTSVFPVTTIKSQR